MSATQWALVFASAAVVAACTGVLAWRRRDRTPAATALAVTVSIGVAVCPADGSDPAALQEAADHALYTAKATGRDRVVAAVPGGPDGVPVPAAGAGAAELVPGR
jgi:GGDEF domain-containing protein